jgi:hypothetical protein
VLDDGNIKLTRKLPVCRREFSFGVPDFIVNSKSIGVVAYDAGGAEQIAWLLGNLTQTPLAFVEGPAIKVFQNLGVRHRVTSDLSEVLKCSLIITGSGWMSNLELTAIKLARSIGLPCVTVLDHWVNYLERFGENEDEKPLILAVTNSEAMKLAQEMFPNKIVWLLPNFQIESYRKAIQSQKTSSSEVLILLEPFSDLDTEFPVNENLVHELILHLLSLRQKKEFQSIRVRLHPSQLENEYILDWLMAYGGEIEVSNSPLLLDDLKKSKLVFGFNSYALYVSSKCEIPSFSCFAGSSKHWTKFFPEIQKLEL